MSRLTTISPDHASKTGPVGVGLRHPHIHDALNETSHVDFVEVHAENFFAKGGLAVDLLHEVAKKYPISLHSTSMGLGSAIGVNHEYLNKLQKLVDQINPIQISDHACFTWSHWNQHSVHAGDLLPLEFSEQSLAVMVNNTHQVQQTLGRRILVENLSSYVGFSHSGMTETEFLSSLTEQTHCGLLVDLNNILVNLRNSGSEAPLQDAERWLDAIPAHAVKEIHLAGYTPPRGNRLIIDDHSQPVSEECWSLYQYALNRFGPVSVLIEWDNNLPPWKTLLEQANRARKFIITDHPSDHFNPQPLAQIQEKGSKYHAA